MLKRLDKWLARTWRRGTRGTPASVLAQRTRSGLVRPQRWDTHFTARRTLRELTPATLLAIFQSADQYLADQIVLACEIEESDTDLAGTLRVRRAAVRRLSKIVQPGDPDEARSVAAAEALTTLVAAGWWGRMEDWLLRALWHQHSAVEVLYNPAWTPIGFRAIEPERYYVDDDLTIALYRDLATCSTADLVAFEPGTFVHHAHSAVAGQPGRYADVRTLAKLWYLAHLNLTGWGKLIDKWGQPFTHFQYDAGSVSNAELRTIVDTFLTLADEMVVATPTGVNVNLQDPIEHTPNREFAEFYSRCVSRFLLGQETAQHATAGQETGATVQAQVRDDLRDEDAESLDDTLATQLVAPWCAWRFGPEVTPPTLRHVIQSVLDQEQRGRVFTGARALGLPIRIAQVYDELGIETPADGDELLGGSGEYRVASSEAQARPGLGFDASETPTPPRDALSGIQINSAIDVLSKVTEATLSNVTAVELLKALGFDEGAAAKMVSSQKLRTKDSSVDDIAFKRELLKQWIADGTISDVVYNATDILKLLGELNVSVEPNYQPPWIPVQTPEGGVVTGETIEDAAGNIVGGDVPIPTVIATGPTGAAW
jgi:phage gp29-like protein